MSRRFKHLGERLDEQGPDYHATEAVEHPAEDTATVEVAVCRRSVALSTRPGSL